MTLGTMGMFSASGGVAERARLRRRGGGEVEGSVGFSGLSASAGEVAARGFRGARFLGGVMLDVLGLRVVGALGALVSLGVVLGFRVGMGLGAVEDEDSPGCGGSSASSSRIVVMLLLASGVEAIPFNTLGSDLSPVVTVCIDLLMRLLFDVVSARASLPLSSSVVSLIGVGIFEVN